MIRHAGGLAFGACVQSIEHDRRARRHPHQIRRGLAKPLADNRRPLCERGIEARAKRRNGGFRPPMKVAVETGRKCRRSARGSRVPEGLLRDDRRLGRLSRGKPDLARHQPSNSVLFAAQSGWARNPRYSRRSRFAGEGHWRIRCSVHPQLRIVRGTLLVSLEYVMNRRWGAALTLGNSAYCLALSITCRNGAPFALRDFGHGSSWFVSQRPLRIFQGTTSSQRGFAELRTLHVQTSPGVTSAYRKLLQAKWVRFLTFSRYRSVVQKFVAWFHWIAASLVNRQKADPCLPEVPPRQPLLAS